MARTLALVVSAKLTTRASKPFRPTTRFRASKESSTGPLSGIPVPSRRSSTMSNGRLNLPSGSESASSAGGPPRPVLQIERSTVSTRDRHRHRGLKRPRRTLPEIHTPTLVAFVLAVAAQGRLGLGSCPGGWPRWRSCRWAEVRARRWFCRRLCAAPRRPWSRADS